MRQKIASVWFLLALGVVLTVGIAWPGVCLPLTSRLPTTPLVGAILFLAALPIDLRVAVGRRSAWLATGLAVALSTVAAPLLGGAVGHWLPTELAIGMVVAAASPCTVASAAVWTRRGGGNDAVAVLVTLLTNAGCFLVLPFWATLLLGAKTDVPAGPLIAKLLLCVVLPIALGQGLRRAPRVGAWAARNKARLGLAAQGGVLMMALVGAAAAGAKLQTLTAPPGIADWLLVIAAAAAIHLVLLAAGWWGALGLRLPRPEAVAAAIAGSQKTLAVGVGIALEFGGLAILPMIAYHAVQLMIDTLFADKVRQRATPKGEAT